MFNSFGEILLSLIYISIFLFIIKKSKFFSDSQFIKSIFYVGFLVKLFAGFALTYIYTYYYTDRLAADIYKYFDDSKILFDTIKSDPAHFLAMFSGIGDNNETIKKYYDTMLNWYKLDLVYNDNHILIRLNALLRFFSFGYFSVHTIAMSFMSYSGMVALFHLFKAQLNCKHYLTFFSLLLVPSLLFWTSGMLKDGLLLGLFGLLLFEIDSIINKGISVKRLSWLVILLLLLIQLKLYVLMIALPGIVLWIYLKNSKINILKSILIWGGAYCLFILVIGNIHYMFPQYDFPRMIAVKQYHFKRLAKETESGSYMEIKDVKPNLISVIKNSPNAWLNVLTKPNLLDSKSPMILLAGIENTILLLLMFLSLIFLDIQRLYYADKLYLFSIFFLVSTFVLIGLVTPVMGAIVRYKSIALPFLIFIILYQFNWDRIKYLTFLKNS